MVRCYSIRGRQIQWEGKIMLKKKETVLKRVEVRDIRQHLVKGWK